MGLKRSLGKAEAELIDAIKETVANAIVEELKKEGKFEETLREIVERKIDPASAAEKLLNKKLGKTC